MCSSTADACHLHYFNHFHLPELLHVRSSVPARCWTGSRLWRFHRLDRSWEPSGAWFGIILSTRWLVEAYNYQWHHPTDHERFLLNLGSLVTSCRIPQTCSHIDGNSRGGSCEDDPPLQDKGLLRLHHPDTVTSIKACQHISTLLHLDGGCGVHGFLILAWPRRQCR